MTKARLIFQLGTNNWQRGEEFAPGSGILHEAHHEAYNSFENTKCFSIYPSKTQPPSDRRDVVIFKLHHDIPICESVSPVSSYRWHSMSDEEFDAYRERLETTVYDYISKIEEEEGTHFSLAIAHHTFLNPLVLRNVNRKRELAGKPKIPLTCFVHGTALKMYVHEASGENTKEFPSRFLPMMKKEKIFGDINEGVSVCFAISNQQVEALANTFPEFPRERVIVSPNGINEKIFHKKDGLALSNVLQQFSTAPHEGSPEKPVQLPGDYDKMVVFVGKFADWKRLDALLYAASTYEEQIFTMGHKVATIIVGSGPLDAQVHYQSLAREKLNLKHCFFLGPQDQQKLALLYNVANIGVFPSHKEPFGMVFIECMACGTPVIGADSGGPRDFVTESVGKLVPESNDTTGKFAQSLAQTVIDSIAHDWKSLKSENCIKLAKEKYSVKNQCKQLLEGAEELIRIQIKKYFEQQMNK